MRTRSVLTSVIVVAAAAGAALLLTFALDWVGGLYLYSGHRNAGLIWGPYSVVRHTTHEFSYVARINNLGFRDRDFTPGRVANKRIIVLGDSFTYGWGVDIHESWPKVLERSFTNAEVANLGAPGGFPRSYADLAEKAILLLRPNVVLVAVVQGDDLNQCAERSPVSRTRRLLTDHYPNLMQLIGPSDVKKLNVSADELAGIWKKQVRDFIAHMEPAERRKFDGLAPPIRAAYEEGQLNPGLLYYSIRFPSFLLDAIDLDAPAARGEIEEMSDQLARISRVAHRWGATVLVVSIPYPPYVSEQHLEAMRELGFGTRSEMLDSTKPDEAIERAARRAGLPFLAVTPAFREQARRASLFFRLDGHLNPLGHRTYAELLRPHIH
jgi:lysophospholipase L1-like esterase